MKKETPIPRIPVVAAAPDLRILNTLSSGNIFKICAVSDPTPTVVPIPAENICVENPMVAPTETVGEIDCTLISVTTPTNPVSSKVVE